MYCCGNGDKPGLGGGRVRGIFYTAPAFRSKEKPSAAYHGYCKHAADAASYVIREASACPTALSFLAREIRRTPKNKSRGRLRNPGV